MPILVFGEMVYGLQDVYMLTRILRHNMKHVIIYTGGDHTHKLGELLYKYLGFGYTNEFYGRGEYRDCIDMCKVPQPWFS